MSLLFDEILDLVRERMAAGVEPLTPGEWQRLQLIGLAYSRPEPVTDTPESLTALSATFDAAPLPNNALPTIAMLV